MQFTLIEFYKKKSEKILKNIGKMQKIMNRFLMIFNDF